MILSVLLLFGAYLVLGTWWAMLAVARPRKAKP